jgi:hypothetical protein
MNKIAVCFFGQLRGDDETFNLILENIVKPNQADVYLHTWMYYEDKEYLFNNPDVDYSMDNIDYAARQTFDEIKFKKFRDLFKPKKIICEEQVIFDNTNYVAIPPQNLQSDWPTKSSAGKCTAHGARLYQGIRSQALSKKRSFKLIENPEDYDIIIMIRNDLFIPSAYDFSQAQIDNNGIILYVINHNYVSDLIFVGGYETMSKMVDFFDHADDIYQNRNSGWTCEFNERHLKSYLESSGVNLINKEFGARIKY